MELRAAPLAREIEGVAGVETNRFALRSVVDIVLAREFELAVFVAPVEANATLRERYAEMIVPAVS